MKNVKKNVPFCFLLSGEYPEVKSGATVGNLEDPGTSL